MGGRRQLLHDTVRHLHAASQRSTDPLAWRRTDAGPKQPHPNHVACSANARPAVAENAGPVFQHVFLFAVHHGAVCLQYGIAVQHGATLILEVQQAALRSSEAGDLAGLAAS